MTLMETNESKPEVPAHLAKIEAELAAMRAEAGEEDAPERTLGAALDEAGIQYESRPVEEDAAPAEEPAEAPQRDEKGRFAGKAEDATEGAEEAEDGLEVFLAASRPQDPRRERAQALESEALELGMSAKEARVLANNTPPEIARKLLDAERARLQSGPADESAQVTQAPPSAGAAEDALTQFSHALEEESGGEAATAAMAAFRALQAQNAELAEQVAELRGFTQAQQEADLSAQTRQIVDGLKGEFPEIVRDGKYDPAVMKHAALLFTNGTPLEDAVRKAARAEYGAVQPARQATTATPGPDVKAPDPLAGMAPDKPIVGPNRVAVFAEIEKRYANDPSALRAAYAKAQRMIQEHNRRARA